MVGAIILGIAVTASGAQTRSQIDYLTRLGESASDLADGPVALSGLTTRLSTISRVEFTTAMDRLAADLETATAILDEEPPTAAVLPVRALYRQAVSAWQEGVAGLSEGLLHGADNPNDNAAVDRVVSALGMLRVGDEVWARLLADMERDDMPTPLVPLPEIVMSPATGPLLPVALVYLEGARADTNTLGLRPGIRVSSLVADPEWQVDANDQAVIPITDQVTFSVVVTNVGNIDTERETLVLTLVGGAEPIQMELPVEPLAPDRQVTLEFDPVSVAPGEVYEVTARITVTSADTDLTDNEIVVQFRIGDE